jgi:hypothetical protein
MNESIKRSRLDVKRKAKKKQTNLGLFFSHGALYGVVVILQGSLSPRSG